jgi:hypothetical protein
MNMNSPAPVPPVEEVPDAAGGSFLGRVMNIYAAPGEAFAEVQSSPVRHVNWVVPLLLSAMVAVVYAMVVFSLPGVRSQVAEQQIRALDRRVEQGKMTAAQGEQAKQGLDNLSPVLMKVAAAVGGSIATAAWLVMLALVLWLISRFALDARVPFGKWIEVAGLSSLIALLGTLATMLVVVIRDNLHSVIGPALFLADFDPRNKLHLALASVNVFTLWYLLVLAAGLARLAQVRYGVGCAWLLGGWVVLRAALILTGLAESGM